MSVITFKGDIVSGDLELDGAVMVCVPAKEHYNTVDLCFKEGMNIQVAEIHVKWLAHKDKSVLGYEIERRWNNEPVLAGQLKAVADAIHYPDCWDTTAYPTLASAIQESVSCNPDCCTRDGN